MTILVKAPNGGVTGAVLGGALPFGFAGLSPFFRRNQ
jgi:hypothetical protein